MCREHELRALHASGTARWEWWGRSLLVWDNGLLEAERELAVAPREHWSSVQHAEWRRVRRLRAWITGPYARASQVLLAAAGVTFVLAARRLASAAAEAGGGRRADVPTAFTAAAEAAAASSSALAAACCAAEARAAAVAALPAAAATFLCADWTCAGAAVPEATSACTS